MRKEKLRINEQIRAPELRVIGADGANLGVMKPEEALAKARAAGLDLIEIAGKVAPPVARITDYGKYQYEQKKKQQEARSKAHTTETKVIQVKVGTGEHDKQLKAKRIEEWLGEGNRVKIDLFLPGRYKYKEFSFLKQRFEAFLAMIPVAYTAADPIAKSPKGLTVVIEPERGSKKKSPEKKDENE